MSRDILHAKGAFKDRSASNGDHSGRYGWHAILERG